MGSSLGTIKACKVKDANNAVVTGAIVAILCTIREPHLLLQVTMKYTGYKQTMRMRKPSG